MLNRIKKSLNEFFIIAFYAIFIFASIFTFALLTILPFGVTFYIVKDNPTNPIGVLTIFVLVTAIEFIILDLLES